MIIDILHEHAEPEPLSYAPDEEVQAMQLDELCAEFGWQDKTPADQKRLASHAAADGELTAVQQTILHNANWI